MPVAKALLDTSVLIDPPPDLPTLTNVGLISTITLAELAYGLHHRDLLTSAARQARYQQILNLFDPLPYSATAARAYGALAAVIRDAGRDPRPRRFDLLIASVAVAEDIPFLTRNPKDLTGLHGRLHVMAVSPNH